MNDIGQTNGTATEQNETLHRLKLHFHQLVTRLHTFNIVVIGGTLTPFICPPGREGNEYALKPIREQSRQALNDWIRTSGAFDAFVDFDQMVRDPFNGTLLRPELDSGDCLHPNDAGNKLMAREFPVNLFTRFENGISTFE
jgi:lysophospholipase L1-like esterase